MMNSASFGSPEPQVTKQVLPEPESMAAPSEPSKSQVTIHEQPIPSIAKLLREKKPEWEAVQIKKRPLYLLDLPVDILGLVVKEVSRQPWLQPARAAILMIGCLDNTHQRSDVARSHLFHTLQLVCPSYLCPVRYSLARFDDTQ